MPEHLVGSGGGTRDVIGAWLVCLAFAAGCFTWLTVAVPMADPRHGERPEGLISSDPIATVVLAKAEPHGRC
jgi:hypothetical protein